MITEMQLVLQFVIQCRVVNMVGGNSILTMACVTGRAYNVSYRFVIYSSNPVFSNPHLVYWTKNLAFLPLLLRPSDIHIPLDVLQLSATQVRL